MREQGPWMQLDLGDVHTISRVLVYGRADYHTDWVAEQNLTGLIIQTDGGQEFRPPTNEWYKYDTFFNFVFPTPISTRYVTLTAPDTRILTICELDVYNDRIISYEKPVEMDSQHDAWEGSRAVDGIESTIPPECECCAATRCSESSWLRVELGDNYAINYVTIYGRTDGTWPGQSYEGMVIEFDREIIQEIPDSSDSKNTTKYFEFRSQRTAAVHSITLTLSHNDSLCKSQLVVCEIEVFGDCISGMYGETSCSHSCGHCRNAEICDRRTGRCSACEDGYIETDMLCTQVCEPGTYGRNCSMTCGHCKNGEICDHQDGTCNQCEDGYTETDMLCVDLCTAGTYGQGCSGKCGYCRYGRTCQRTDGQCEHCEDGYDETDLTCNTECQEGWYGRNCTEICGNCNNNETCSKSDGYCSSCEHGYDQADRTCKTECLDGYYGDCTTPCGQCRGPGTCNKQTGICPHGCNPGFRGDICTTDCEAGKFGVDCTRCCGMCNNDDVCDKITGNCPNGCVEGFTGARCLSETIDEQASISIAVLAGSIAATAVITAILTLLVAFSIHRMLRSRSRDEVPSKPQWESNYDSLDLSSIQTSEATSTTPS